jgi:hypothetical protein
MDECVYNSNIYVHVPCMFVYINISERDEYILTKMWTRIYVCTYIYIHVCGYTYIHFLSLSFFLSLTLSHSLSLTHTHTLSLSLASLSLARSLARSLTLTRAHIRLNYLAVMVSGDDRVAEYG